MAKGKVKEWGRFSHSCREDAGKLHGKQCGYKGGETMHPTTERWGRGQF